MQLDPSHSGQAGSVSYPIRTGPSDGIFGGQFEVVQVLLENKMQLNLLKLVMKSVLVHVAHIHTPLTLLLLSTWTARVGWVLLKMPFSVPFIPVCGLA